MSSFLARIAHHRNALIGAAVGSVAVAAAFSQMSTIANEAAVHFADKDQWYDLKLVKFEDVSPDTRKFVFALGGPDQKAGLTTASCVLAKFVTPKGSNVIRPYTPVSDPEQQGTIDFIVKKYPTGKMGNHLFDLKVDDTLSFKGPIVKWAWKPNQFDEITLIGGGSGITPLYQLLHQITKDPQDKTKVHLIYGNKTPQDILLKEDLDAIAAKYSDQVKLTYFLDKESAAVKANVGYISKDWLKENIAGPSEKHHVYVCGPPPMCESISGNKVSPSDQGEVTGALKELGFTKEHVFKF